ncbi:NUDIX domain-containing protein [Paractinoplanes ferrugineus]|uniref:NUDIX hydrolase n=1 Tax=Paractinoplanes ferrugineus TaxID=113564 RepID=A0A919MLU2_9ACTN|nr:NUDIX domain-containing protein [Actinoplanes ferrugineus]GIE12557.1 NUDIX hydrolase [Actinoplanes ferrugineus]
MPVSPYIVALREHIGHDLLLLPSATAVVFDDGGRVLLIRRGDNGRWSLPSGMIDPGEQPADAAVREVLEETGIVAEVDVLAGVATHPVEYPNGDVCEYMNVWFRCRAVGGTPTADGDESLEVGWFARDALAGLDEWGELRLRTAAGGRSGWFQPAGAAPHPALTRPDAL